MASHDYISSGILLWDIRGKDISSFDDILICNRNTTFTTVFDVIMIHITQKYTNSLPCPDKSFILPCVNPCAKLRNTCNRKYYNSQLNTNTFRLFSGQRPTRKLHEVTVMYENDSHACMHRATNIKHHSIWLTSLARVRDCLFFTQIV